MEKSIEEFRRELYKAEDRGYINGPEIDKALDEYKKNGNTDILSLIDERKKTREIKISIINKNWNELTELEALQTIVLQNKSMIEAQRGIKGWITFMGIVLIIWIVLSILSAFSILTMF